MKNQFNYYLVAIFSIFLGSQITEGILLVPYWQSLSVVDFYTYYAAFGPGIGQYYTILTISAAIIPIGVSFYLYSSKSNNLKYALISSIFAILFIVCFYIYFKNTNQLFYESAFNEADLKSELITWSIWHWGRVVLEFISLVFLIVAFRKEK